MCGIVGPLAACSAQLSREGAVAPSTASASPSPPPSALPSSAAPTAAAPTAAAPTPPAAPPLGPARTDVPDAAVLPAQQPVGDVSGLVAWTVPQGCQGGRPSAAAAMRTVTDGDGQFEAVVRVQQVVAFPDVATAVAEATRLRRAMERCADDGDADPDRLRTVGPVAVGAQGYGLARRYRGAASPLPLGTYTAITRRGNALTLLAHTGGEISVEGSRRAVVADAQAAWERLCLYDRTAGCPAG